MAGNQLPANTGQLIGLATKMDAGLNQYGTELKITQITPAEFDADLKAFIAQDKSYNAARSARQDASNDYQGSYQCGSRLVTGDEERINGPVR